MTMTPAQIKRRYQDMLNNEIFMQQTKLELSWSRVRRDYVPETEEEVQELAEHNIRFEEADEIKELAEFGCPNTDQIEFLEQTYHGYEFRYRALVAQNTWDWMQNKGMDHRLVNCQDMTKRELSWSRVENTEPPETEEEEQEVAEADIRFEQADEIKELAKLGCPDTDQIEFIEQSDNGDQFNYRALVTQKTWDWMQNEGLRHRFVEC